MSQDYPEFKEPVSVSSGIDREDKAYFLVIAVISTLHVQRKLRELRISNEDEHLIACEAEVCEAEFPCLQVDDFVMESYERDHLFALYERLEVTKLRDSDVLNMWIRAWSEGVDTFMGIHQNCLSAEVLANLVECGGDILQSLKL